MGKSVGTIILVMVLSEAWGHQAPSYMPQQPQHQHTQQGYMQQQQPASYGQHPPPQQGFGQPAGSSFGAPQHAPHGSGNILDKSHVQDKEHIKEHLQGLVDQPDFSKMTEEELQFHYFKMHDNDDNNKLDGCELIKSVLHWHVEESRMMAQQQQQQQYQQQQPPHQQQQQQQYQQQQPPQQQQQYQQQPPHQQQYQQPQGGHQPQPPSPSPGGVLGTTKIFTDQELISMIDPIMEMDDKNRDGFIDYPEFVAAQKSRGF